MYPEEMVLPMKVELTEIGFKELKDKQEVVDAFALEGTKIVVVNSVCGCAAANARPAVKLSLKHSNNKPQHLYTVFAGVDKEATEKAREYMLPFPPSSPAIAIFRDDELVHMLERHHIEGRPAEMISENLVDAYDKYCKS